MRSLILAATIAVTILNPQIAERSGRHHETSPEQAPLGKAQRQDGARSTPNDRLFLIKPKGYVHAGAYIVPGYYTLLSFSASWCEPCHMLRKRIPALLVKYPNLVVVDLDIGQTDKLNPKGSSILMDIGPEATLPAALLFNPFGLYANRQDARGVARPICGFDEILKRVDSALGKRKHLAPLPMGSSAMFSTLQKMQLASDHYASARSARDKGQSDQETQRARLGQRGALSRSP